MVQENNSQVKSTEVRGLIHSVESFGSVDGPGVRYIYFLSGCHMRCKYCHNPDTWDASAGVSMTASEAFEKAYKYRAYWKENGGISVSGGEALLQIDFVIELFKIAKKNGVNTVLDTSGNSFTRKEPFFSKFNELMKYTDLFLVDIKQIDDQKHKELTGWSNANILDMVKYLSDEGKDMWIRHVLVPGITDSEEDLKGLGEFVKTLKTVKRFEILPYHTLGIFKWEQLGKEYPLADVKTPTKESIEKANEILETSRYTGYLE
ncbi:pyruvate formate-lyase-activating protein [Anaerosporobacter sp.]